jgi:cyclic pyranopterin monophosphate synthase
MDKNSFFSHIREEQPSMVDIGEKQITKRSAIAQAIIKIGPILGAKLQEKDAVNNKGPVFHTAIIAGTMAAKNTANLIPFCHPLALSQVSIDIDLSDIETITIFCRVKTEAKTGAEMEALSGASVAALTIYDMCKSVSHDMIIAELKLIKKTGGKSDFSS